MVPVARGPLRQLEESLDEEDARVADLALAVGVLLGGEVEAALEHVLVPLAVGEPGAGRQEGVRVIVKSKSLATRQSVYPALLLPSLLQE